MTFAACELDLVFLIDESGSITDNQRADEVSNWITIKEFIKQVTNSFRIGPSEVRVGAVKFGNMAKIYMPLNSLPSNFEVLAAFDRMPHAGGNTNMTGGLRVVRTQVFGQSGDRPDVRDIVILITDGEATWEKERLLIEAQLAKNAGITIIGVGITNHVNVRELQAVTSQPTSVYYNPVPDFRMLLTSLNNVVTGACFRAWGLVPGSAGSWRGITSGGVGKMAERGVWLASGGMMR